jgi:Carboxypeptidase regulatory-like domain/TonB-dependent Receptor Plug Domain
VIRLPARPFAFLAAGGVCGTLPAAAQTASPPAQFASVSGVVYDSLIAHGPLRDAEVVVMGSGSSDRTDGRGRFHLDSVPVGHQVLAIFHPSFDSLGIGAPLREIDVPARGIARLQLDTPSRTTIFHVQCGSSDAPEVGLLAGRVGDVDTGEPLAGAIVEARWNEWLLGQGGLTADPKRVAAVTDSLGRFGLCGAATDIALEVHAGSGEYAAGTIEYHMHDEPFAVLALEVSRRDTAARVAARAADSVAVDSLPAQSGGSARLIAHVRDNAGRVAVNAEVSVLGIAQSARTDANGVARLIGIPAGSVTLQTRALGFAPASRIVALRTNAARDVDVVLDRNAVILATMKIVGRAPGRDRVGLNDRMRSGMGHYLTRDQFQKDAPFDLGDVLRRMPGLWREYVRGNAIYTMRGSTSLAVLGSGGNRCRPTFFLDGMPLFGIDDSYFGAPEHYILADEVEAVEVYSGLGTIPAQFDRHNGCGSILVWTRTRLRR